VTIDPGLVFDRALAGDPFAIGACVAAFCAAACVYSLFFQYRVWHWPHVWGVLGVAGKKQTLSSGTSMADRQYVARVSYTYDVDGQAYEGHRLSAMQVEASHNARAVLDAQLKGIERQDGRVKVYYKPGNPAKSYLIRGSLTQVVLTAGMMAAAIAVCHRFLEKMAG